MRGSRVRRQPLQSRHQALIEIVASFPARPAPIEGSATDLLLIGEHQQARQFSRLAERRLKGLLGMVQTVAQVFAYPGGSWARQIDQFAVRAKLLPGRSALQFSELSRRSRTC